MQQSTKITNADRSEDHRGVEMCVHWNDGRTRIPKICLRAHECWHCAFDQWAEAMDGREAVDKRHDQSGFLRAMAA
jgi:hypothetical protein